MSPGNKALQTDSSPDAEERPHRTDLLSMRPMVGDALQLDCGTPFGSQKTYSRLIGYIRDKFIVVTTPLVNGRRLELLENDSVLVRGFSGINAYAFRAHVLRVSRLPQDHVFLSYPAAVFGRPVRGSHRTRIELEVTLEHDEGSTQARLLDLSAHGALLSADNSLAQQSTVTLRLELLLHGTVQSLQIRCTVMHSKPSDEDGSQLHHYGLRFDDVDEHNSMLLKAYVYEQVVDRPESIF